MKKKAKKTPKLDKKARDALLTLEVNEFVQNMSGSLLGRLEESLSTITEKQRWLIGSRVINLMMMRHYTATTEAQEKAVDRVLDKQEKAGG
jgi:hypothetical protein